MSNLGDAVEDVTLLPDPLCDFMKSSSIYGSIELSTSRPFKFICRDISVTAAGSGLASSVTLDASTAEDTPQGGGTLCTLHPPRSTYNFKDDMEVFYPQEDVHPITRTLDKLWDADRSNQDQLFADKKPPSSLLFPWPG